jgi:hypothetical protein
MARFLTPLGSPPSMPLKRPPSSARLEYSPDTPQDATARLGRGVYSSHIYGYPFCFLERSDGVRFGLFVPDGMPEHEMLARLYVRLATDDPQPQLRLLA